MELDIILKNYRCFSESRPVTLGLRGGLTAFVGPNNSGKSALLRFFYEFRPFFGSTPDKSSWTRLLAGQSVNVRLPPEILDFEELFSFTNRGDISVEIVQRNTVWEPWPWTIVTRRLPDAIAEITVRGLPRSPLSFQDAPGDETFAVSGTVRLPFSAFRAAMDRLCDTVYIGAFRNALNRGEDRQDYFDMPVGQHFIATWAECQTGNTKRLNNAAAQVIKDVREIFGFDTLHITAAPQNRRLSFEINGRPLKDHEVGSGLTQILMVLATVAMKAPCYILIDEPELNLHPSLQVKFLMALAKYAREGVLFGTHSIGLARTVADRIFSVQQSNDGQSEVRPFDDTRNLAELLGEMSFSAYREMGFEKILLVEGRTEVRVVQHWLRLLAKDHKVVPVPLGGSTLICPEAEHELSELTRLCSSIYALIDSERTAEGANLDAKRKGFQEICTKLRIDCHVLERRAIENYFSAAAIAKAFPNHHYGTLGAYQRLGQPGPAWAKTDNWRIAAEMTRAELLETDLGAFLDGI